MKKLMMVAAAAVAAMGLFTGCGKQADDGKTKFVVGFDADFPPYGYKEGAEYKGFDLDLAREVCARRGWTFVANPVNWDAKDMELNSGSISCIWNGFTIQGREAGYTWTEPYVDNSQVVLVKAGSPVKSLKDLAGKTVGVQTRPSRRNSPARATRRTSPRSAPPSRSSSSCRTTTTRCWNSTRARWTPWRSTWAWRRRRWPTCPVSSRSSRRSS